MCKGDNFPLNYPIHKPYVSFYVTLIWLTDRVQVQYYGDKKSATTIGSFKKSKQNVPLSR